VSEDPRKSDDAGGLLAAVAARAERHRLAHRSRQSWFGLGMFGLVGWSIAVPTLVGVAGGRYLDEHFARSFSWTLTLLLAGIAIGCANAWYWIQQERRRE